MTGYDQTTSYSTSQYNYVPNLSTTTSVGNLTGQNGGPHPGDPSGSLGDPRQLHGWGGGYHQAHHHPHLQQNSPTQQRYPYYDSRNGYYLHQGAQNPLDTQSWHEPVLPVQPSTTPRPDSPTLQAHQGLSGYPGGGSGNDNGGMNSPQGGYNCKMGSGGSMGPNEGSGGGGNGNLLAVSGPPSPISKANDNPNATSSQLQYQQYQPCTLSQQPSSQQPVYNNNHQPPGASGPPGRQGGPQGTPQQQPVHNSYSLSPEDHVGQPSPVSQQAGAGGGGGGGGSGGPPNQNQQGAPQAPLPSPLYPWMRSQFGKSS